MALNFSETQKKISQYLLQGPLSLEQLAKKTGLEEKALQEEMKLLLQLKLVTLAGTPPVYAMKEEIGKELAKRKALEQDDDNKFRVQISIEVQGIEEELVKKQIARILDALGKEPFYRIYSTHIEPATKIEDLYSSFADINLSVRDFRALVRLMFFYGPASVEVIKPSKIEFTAQDFQDGLVDMTEMVQGYAHYIMGLMNRQKVDDFHSRLIEAAQKAEGMRKSAQNPAETPIPTEK